MAILFILVSYPKFAFAPAPVRSSVISLAIDFTKACDSPMTIPSSRYSDARFPAPRHFLLKGPKTLVNAWPALDFPNARTVKTKYLSFFF